MQGVLPRGVERLDEHRTDLPSVYLPGGLDHLDDRFREVGVQWPSAVSSRLLGAWVAQFVPNRGGQGEQALSDAGAHTLTGATSVAF